MVTDDLVSRVLSAITEREQAANAVVQREWLYGPPQLPHGDGCGFVEASLEIGSVYLLAAGDEDDPLTAQQAEHIALNDPHAVLRLCQAHRDILDLFPVSAPHLDTEGNFYGFQSRDCGEHRTVGAHRAWCHDCDEWCYLAEPCRRCHGVSNVIRILARAYGIEDIP